MLLPVHKNFDGFAGLFSFINSLPCAKESFFIRGVYCSFNPFFHPFDMTLAGFFVGQGL